MFLEQSVFSRPSGRLFFVRLLVEMTGFAFLRKSHGGLLPPQRSPVASRCTCRATLPFGVTRFAKTPVAFLLAPLSNPFAFVEKQKGR